MKLSNIHPKTFPTKDSNDLAKTSLKSNHFKNIYLHYRFIFFFLP